MQGLYYLLSIIAVFIVLLWYARNDGMPDDQPTKGLLAMKTPADAAPESVPRKRPKWSRENLR